MLVASHIIPWADDPKQRMNPRNGLCLNALHDRAFDRGLMFVAKDLTVHFREKLVKYEKKSPGLDWLLSYEGKSISEPCRFRPDITLLEIHSSK
jgi:putative restriction endonuclease